MRTAFSEAQTEIERLQFQLAESRDARTLDSERRLKEWERREKELRVKVAEEEKRKWEVWDGERRGRESQVSLVSFSASHTLSIKTFLDTRPRS